MHSTPMESAFHESVLFEETLAALQPSGGREYRAVDCTVGAGGHAFGLLDRSSPDGALVGLDADPMALDLARERLAPFAGRFTLLHRNFRDLARVADELGLKGAVHGVVADLGLSSMQLDRSGRGFSFRADEPLDMRFDPSDPERPTAAELLNTLPETDLADVFWRYGEERRSRRLARVIVSRRERGPFASTGDLVAAVTEALGPRRGKTSPATRPFQALRIAVNDELSTLETGLDAARDLLAPGGRLAVISFHSLEDRIVKWRMRAWAAPADGSPPLVRVLTKKPLLPSPAEVDRNPRSRSAKLRVAERLEPTVDASA